MARRLGPAIAVVLVAFACGAPEKPPPTPARPAAPSIADRCGVPRARASFYRPVFADDDLAVCDAECARAAGEACVVAGVIYEKGPNEEPDPAKAAERYARACDANVAAACLHLGRLQEAGLGVAKDPAKAFASYERACAGGDGYGCNNLAVALGNGVGTRADPAKAMESYRRLCAEGELRACANLAQALGDGPEVVAEVRALGERACAGGVPTGCWNLAYDLERGRFGPADRAAAVAHYDRACALGDPSGCLQAGEAHLAGLGVAPDPAKAAEAYRIGCELRQTGACIAIAQMTRDGVGVQADAAAADRLFLRGCPKSPAGCFGASIGWSEKPSDALLAFARYGFAELCERNLDHAGCVNAGVMEREGRGGAPDEARALRAFEIGCDEKQPSACFNLGAMIQATEPARAVALFQGACPGETAACVALAGSFERGHGLPRDERRALAIFERVRVRLDEQDRTALATLNGKLESRCKARDLEACRRIGFRHAHAIGVAPSFERAVGFWGEACAGDSPEDDGMACAFLGLAHLRGSGVRRDEKRGLRLLEHGCLMDSRACVALALALAEGADLPRDDKRAAKVFGRACDLGIESACGLRAYYAFDGRKGYAAERAAVEAACAKRDPHACAALGVARERGAAGVPRDLEGARAAYSAGCAEGAPMACARLARSIEGPKRTGRGEALDAWRSACALDDAEGCERASEELGKRGKGDDQAAAEALRARACALGRASSCGRGRRR